MNINLDSTNIIITGHKIVESFLLLHFLLPASILGAMFRVRARIFFSFATICQFDLFGPCIATLSQVILI